MVFHGATAFLQYGQAMKGNGAPYYFACSVNAVLASIGLWCLLFATDRGHISRKVRSFSSVLVTALDWHRQGKAQKAPLRVCSAQVVTLSQIRRQINASKGGHI